MSLPTSVRKALAIRTLDRNNVPVKLAAAGNRELDQLLAAYAEKSAVADAAKREKDAVGAELEAAYSRLGVMKHEAKADNGAVITGTWAQSTSTIVDEEKLKKSVGAAVWTRITRRTLDKDLLKAEVVKGSVSDVQIGQASTVTTNKPYVRVTTKAPKDTAA